jgi:hypothetical protein
MSKIAIIVVNLVPETSEPKVKAFVPMYEPLKPETCKKCGNVIAESKELIRRVPSE